MKSLIYKYHRLLLVIGILVFGVISFWAVATQTPQVNIPVTTVVANAKKSITFDTLTCQGLENKSETYQFDCLSPKRPDFIMKDNLTCHMLTNHQMSLVNNQSKDGKSIELTTIKANYRKITLRINSSNRTIIRNPEPGEYLIPIHAIITNDENTLISVGTTNTQKSEVDGVTPTPDTNSITTPDSEVAYETITILKNSGLGIFSGHYSPTQNGFENVRVEYFQCE